MFTTIEYNHNNNYRLKTITEIMIYTSSPFPDNKNKNLNTRRNKSYKSKISLGFTSLPLLVVTTLPGLQLFVGKELSTFELFGALLASQ